MGTAPAPGAVFRALAENFGRAEFCRRGSPVARAGGWPRGRGQLRPRAGVLPSFGFQVKASLRPLLQGLGRGGKLGKLGLLSGQPDRRRAQCRRRLSRDHAVGQASRLSLASSESGSPPVFHCLEHTHHLVTARNEFGDRRDACPTQLAPPSPSSRLHRYGLAGGRSSEQAGYRRQTAGQTRACPAVREGGFRQKAATGLPTTHAPDRSGSGLWPTCP